MRPDAQKFRGCGGLYLLSLILVLVLATFCRPVPAFPGGIRVITVLEDLITGAQFAKGGVFVRGTMIQNFGPPNTGFSASLSGITDSQGILDSPDAITNATWNFTDDWTLADPRCPPLVPNSNAFIKLGGDTVTDICDI